MGTQPSVNCRLIFSVTPFSVHFSVFADESLLFPAETRRDAGHIKNQWPSQRSTSCDTSGTGLSTKFKLIFGTCSSSFRRNLRGQLCHYYRAMKQRKAQIIKARVSTNMKRGIDNLADKRGESEAVIVREALSQYLRKSTILLESKPSHRPKKPN
jgi:Ribbon-helix-helix protein, copG family